jgi:hypothetical protein
MKIKTILVLLCFTIAIVGIIAPVNALSDVISSEKSILLNLRRKK